VRSLVVRIGVILNVGTAHGGNAFPGAFKDFLASRRELFSTFPEVKGLVEGHVACFEAGDDSEKFVTCGLKSEGVNVFDWHNSQTTAS
jgi:hypothetical protein